MKYQSISRYYESKFAHKVANDRSTIILLYIQVCVLKLTADTTLKGRLGVKIKA